MVIPKLAELPGIPEETRMGLQAIIGTKNIAEWKELFKSAALDLIKTVKISADTHLTLRTIQKGINADLPEYAKGEIEKKLGIQLSRDVVLRVERVVAPIPPIAYVKSSPMTSEMPGSPVPGVLGEQPNWIIPAKESPVASDEGEIDTPVEPTKTVAGIKGITLPSSIKKEIDKEVALEAKQYETELERRKAHPNALEKCLMNHEGTPEGGIYARFLEFLREEVPNIDWEFPFFDEVTINTRNKTVRSTLAYWARIKCNDERRKSIILDAFSGYVCPERNS